MDIRQAVLSELEGLPEARQADVLAFIRLLKVGPSDTPQEIERHFDQALAHARAGGAELGLTEQDVADEVRRLPPDERIALWRLLDAEVDRTVIAQRFSEALRSIRAAYPTASEEEAAADALEAVRERRTERRGGPSRY